MRALIDTNLLSPSPASSATGVVFQAALQGAFTLLLTVGVTAELDRKLSEDPALARRLRKSDAEELVTLLRSVAEDIPLLPDPYPEIGRDRKDDFLIAHSVIAQADYLVTWDKDLRVLEKIEGFRIVSPPEFLQVLRQAGLV